MANRFSIGRAGAALQLTLALCAAVALGLAMNLASQTVRAQDERALWSELARAYVEGGEGEPDFATMSLAVEAGDVSVLTRTAASLRTFDASHIATARFNARERRCLAEAVFYEARSENIYGRLAVAEVVLNRVAHRAYPNTICEVVYQGSERVTGCQFTFTCDGSMARAPYGRGWIEAQKIAEHALMGFARPVTRRATHYHTIAVDPHWNDSLVRTRKIGTHIFYRFPNRTERRMLLGDREA